MEITTTRALLDGVRRVNRAPAVIAGVMLVTIATALPASMVLRETLRAHLGSSLAADEAARGVNYEWWTEFSDQSSGLGGAFSTTIIGFAATLDNLSGFLDNQQRPPAIVWLIAVYLGIWLWLTGGILDRYARDRATRSHGFFTACGIFFVRFLRLAPLVALIYYVLFAHVHGWLFGELYDWLTRDVTVERTAFLWRAGLYATFGLLLVFANVVFDYAKVRAVVEDRRSMIGAVTAGVRFVRRNPGAVFGLYLFGALLFVLVLALYAAIAPGAGATGMRIWVGFAISQVYVLARLWVKLVFCASEIALFQGRLAHAGYTASPLILPPEPPAAEQLSRTKDSGSPDAEHLRY